MGDPSRTERAGALVGNHVITLENIGTELRDLGTMLLWKGAQKILLEYFHGARSPARVRMNA